MADDNDNNHGRRHVTNRELKEELEKLPTRWEVRFLILAALIFNQLVPTLQIAKAGIKAVAP